MKEILRHIFDKKRAYDRILSTRLTALVKGTTSIERLAVIEAIEETGNVLFRTILPLAEAIERHLGAPMRYCGSFHFERKSGHAVGADHRRLARLTLAAEDTRDRPKRSARRTGPRWPRPADATPVVTPPASSRGLGVRRKTARQVSSSPVQTA